MSNTTGEKKWYNYGIVIFTGILVLYTVSSSILILFNL